MSRALFSSALVAALLLSSSAFAQDVDGYRPAREVLGDAAAVDSSRSAAPSLDSGAVEEADDAERTAAAPVEAAGDDALATDDVDTAAADEAVAPVVELPPAGETVGMGDATIRVTVRGRVGDAFDAPIPNQHVELTTLQPPHSVIQRLDAVTGEDGVATFEAISGEGVQAFARAFREGREVFAATGINLTEAKDYQMTVQDMPVVDDPRVVFAPRVITIAEVWEDYLVFTQIFTLATDQPVIFQADGTSRSSGLLIPLPKDAAGVRVIQPADKAEAAGDAIMFRGEVTPSGAGDQTPSLIVRYSLRHNNRATVRWTQKFGFDVENLSLVVPQQTDHPGHPHIDVAIDVPMCADGAEPGVMCFEDLSDTAEGVQLLQGKAVRVARGGKVRSGGELRVTTSGWPADPRWGRWASGVAVALAFILAAALVVRTRRRSVGEQSVRARLDSAKDKLLRRIEELELAYLAGQVLELEYEAEQELIVGELALIQRRLRELPSGAARD